MGIGFLCFFFSFLFYSPLYFFWGLTLYYEQHHTMVYEDFTTNSSRPMETTVEEDDGSLDKLTASDRTEQSPDSVVGPRPQPRAGLGRRPALAAEPGLRQARGRLRSLPHLASRRPGTTRARGCAWPRPSQGRQAFDEGGSALNAVRHTGRADGAAATIILLL